MKLHFSQNPYYTSSHGQSAQLPGTCRSVTIRPKSPMLVSDPRTLTQEEESSSPNIPKPTQTCPALTMLEIPCPQCPAALNLPKKRKISSENTSQRLCGTPTVPQPQTVSAPSLWTNDYFYFLKGKIPSLRNNMYKSSLISPYSETEESSFEKSLSKPLF